MEQGPARKPALPTVSFAAAGAAAVSLAVVAVPWLRMSVEAPSLRVALETGGSLLAVTTVVLLLRQCGLRSRADHLWLTAGLVILAATALAVAGMIVAGAWSPTQARYAMGGNLAGTLMLAIAAFAPSRKLRVQPRTRPGRAPERSASWSPPSPRCSPASGPRMRAPNATGRLPPGDRARDRAGRDRRRARRRRRRPRPPRRSRCCAGSPSRSCSPASPSSTTRSSRRWAPTTSTSATSCAWPPGACCSPACSSEVRARIRQRAEAAVDRRAPPARPRAARRRRPGTRLHPPPRRPPGRDAGRRRDRRRRRPRARGLAARDRGAGPARPRAAGRRAGAPRRAPGDRVRGRGAGQRARRHRHRRRGPRRARSGSSPRPSATPPTTAARATCASICRARRWPSA